MPIRLGDRGAHVRKWRTVMASRFAGYAREVGELPTDTDEYGARAVAWQKVYERRTSQPIDGVVSDDDLRGLGISPGNTSNTLPWLFTVHGTGMADPLGPGLPADTARDVLDKYRWQPIGNYPATPFPMWPSIEKGVNELIAQIETKLTGNNDTFAMAGYSQGAVVVGQVLKHHIMNPTGRLHRFLPRLRKVVFWGNPMRQKGIAHFDEWIHPIAPRDSFGIMEDRLEGLESAPFQVRDYAHAGDMYASVTEGDKDEYKIMIQKIVFRATDFYIGEDSVVSQLREFTQRPLQEGIAAAMAAIDAIRFFTNTAHGYNIFPAIEFLREA